MPGTRRPSRPTTLVAGLALAAALTTSACGGSVEVPTPSGTRTVELPSASVSVPSIERPSATEPPEATDTPEASEPPEPTRTPDATPAPTVTETATSEPEPAETVTETAAPTPSETETPSPTPSPTETDIAAPASEEADEGGVPAWVWWLAALGVLAVAVVLLLRSRRRAAWDVELEAAQAEVTWLARDLLPRVRATGTREAAAGAWAVSGDRVQALEDKLTWLEATAPAEPRRLRAEVLRDAVRDVHARAAALTQPGSDTHFTEEVDAVVATLEDALTRSAPQP
ncbi:hypothetical protein GCM10023168_30960 [Fodinibacter luteus]|uniref:Uncharacterized protein n=1 Tax=Fodinibacter luteus TaxID=552064 RepID=A0ABP8KP70_9MICO